MLSKYLELETDDLVNVWEYITEKPNEYYSLICISDTVKKRCLYAEKI